MVQSMFVQLSTRVCAPVPSIARMHGKVIVAVAVVVVVVEVEGGEKSSSLQSSSSTGSCDLKQ